jgi:hypothetical protein
LWATLTRKSSFFKEDCFIGQIFLESGLQVLEKLVAQELMLLCCSIQNMARKKQITIYFILLFYVASTTTKWNDGPQIMIIGLEHIIFESKSVWLVEKEHH